MDRISELIGRQFVDVHVHVKAFWNRPVLFFALLLALPVGLEACSAPGTLDETDQPHALIGADDDGARIDVQASDVPTSFMDQADLPALTCIQPVAMIGLRSVEPRWNTSGLARGMRLHRWLCRELC